MLAKSGGCSWAYVLSSPGAIQDKSPRNAPEDIQGFLTEARVVWNGLVYELTTNDSDRRIYTNDYGGAYLVFIRQTINLELITFFSISSFFTLK